MIEQLTPEQIARSPEFIDKWTKIGLSTEPADRPRAEAAIRLMYENTGLPLPEQIVWFDSPTAMFTKYKKTDNRSVSSAVWDAVRGAVGDVIHGAVWDVAVSSAVSSAVWDAVWDAVWGAVRNAVGNVVYGSHEAYWLAEYDYFREVLGLVKETDKLVGLFELAKSCGWVLPCEKICYASERPNILNLDNKRKLHCEDGPAVRYPDGWRIYVDHGVRVSEKVVVDPGGFTLKELKELKTHEVKIVFRKIGMEKFMSVPGTTSDTWTDLFSQIAKETVND